MQIDSDRPRRLKTSGVVIYLGYPVCSFKGLVVELESVAGWEWPAMGAEADWVERSTQGVRVAAWALPAAQRQWLAAARPVETPP